MNHIPLLIPFYLMVILAIHARGKTNSQLELSLKKISRTSKTAEGKIEYEFTLQSETEISDINCILLNVKKESHETNYENSNISKIESSKEVTVPFKVEQSEFAQQMTIIMTVHNDAWETLAYVTQDWLHQEINPELVWVGPTPDSKHKHSLSVKTNIDITFDDYKCDKASSPCYFLHFPKDEIPEICTEAKSDISTVIPDVLECDTTLTIAESPDLSTVKEITLTHKSEGSASLKINAMYGEDSESMDILIYEETDITAADKCHCQIQKISDISQCECDIQERPQEEPFRILLVTMNTDGLVTESNEYQFVDKRTEIQILTSKSVLVGWNSADSLPYTVKLTQKTPEKTPEEETAEKTAAEETSENTAGEETSDKTAAEEIEVSLTCGGEENTNCKAYFLDLDEKMSYTASVTYTESVLNVSYTVAADFDWKKPDLPLLNIVKLTELNSDTNSPESFNVTLTSPQPITFSRIYLAIIDSQVPSNPNENIDFFDGDGELSEKDQTMTFSIDKSLLTQKENLAMVVTAHASQVDDESAIAVATVNTDFKDIDPQTVQVNEVGTESKLWVRVKTGDLDLTVNGHKCTKNNVTYFVKETDFVTPLKLCRNAGMNLDGKTEMQQCRIGGVVVPLGDQIYMNTIELTYPGTEDQPSMSFSGEFKDGTNSLEGMFCNTDTPYELLQCNLNEESTNGPSSCTISNVDIKEDQFTILIVALNEGGVAESTAVGFEDYKTSVYPITTDIIEVSWNALDKTTYKCYLNADENESVNYVDCGGDEQDKCLTFFTGLEASTNYIVRVKKRQRGDLNIVGIETTTS